MKNAKSEESRGKKDEFRGKIPQLKSAEKPTFCGSARNSTARGKLWALILSCCSFYLEFTSLTESIVTNELHAFAQQTA